MKSVKTKGKSFKTADIRYSDLPAYRLMITFDIPVWYWVDKQVVFDYYVIGNQEAISQEWENVFNRLCENHTKSFSWELEFLEEIEPEDITREFLDSLTDEYYEAELGTPMRLLHQYIGWGQEDNKPPLPPSSPPSGGFNLPRGTKTAIGAYVGYKAGKKIGGSGFFN